MQKNWRKGAFPVDRHIVELIAICTWGAFRMYVNQVGSDWAELLAAVEFAIILQISINWKRSALRISPQILSSDCFLVSPCESEVRHNFSRVQAAVPTYCDQ